MTEFNKEDVINCGPCTWVVTDITTGGLDGERALTLRALGDQQYVDAYTRDFPVLIVPEVIIRKGVEARTILYFPVEVPTESAS